MTTLALLTIVCAVGVGWANGANDVSKGVATLVGSRLATYRQGLHWGSVWTVAGSFSALLITTTMVRTFSTGLVTGTFATSATFPIAVAVGVSAWVLIASRTGLPVSTTHSLAGAIAGAAFAAGGPGGVRWALAVSTVAAPLAFSPAAAAGLAYLTHAIASRRLCAASRFCVCVREKPLVLASESPAGSAAVVRAVTFPLVIVDEARACSSADIARHVRITDAAHWMSSAALSFARGLNDTPKIVALGAGAATAVGFASASLYVLIAMIIGLGGVLSGRRVTETLAERVTDVDPLEGLAASTVAATLVLIASFVALPVSTTHVASGAIIGVGLRSGSRGVEWRMVSSIGVAWLVTLPASAIVAALAWWIAASALHHFA